MFFFNVFGILRRKAIFLTISVSLKSSKNHPFPLISIKKAKRRISPEFAIYFYFS